MPDIQLIVAGFIVAVAALFLLRQWLRPWLGTKGGCGGGCGCSSAVNQSTEKSEVLIPVEELQVRKR